MRRLALLLAVAGLSIGATAAARGQAPEGPPAGEAPGADIPSVSVLPVGTAPDDPNAGQWFVTTASTGQTSRLAARIFNPATVDQVVQLGLADLDFGRDGTPLVADVSEDVGTWGGFDQPTVTVAAGQEIVAGFSVTVPEGAEPGDHVGVVLATTRPQGAGAVKVVKRVATRLYVTVPGDAQPAFVIEDVTMRRDSAFFPRSITFTVTLRNTGRVRLEPTVTVDGKQAGGSDLLMTRSVEPYTLRVPVPVWGGPLKFDIEGATRTATRAGPTRTLSVSTFIVPWVLLLGLAAAALLGLGSRKLLKGRFGRYDALRADLRRLERLLAEREPGSNGERRQGRPAAEDAIRTAMKRAARAGDHETEAKLRAKLDEATPGRPSSRSGRPRGTRSGARPTRARR